MDIEIRNKQGEQLDYAFHAASGGCHEGRIVLIGHGVTGNKDRPWASALGEACARAGVDALRFSFAGNGDSEGKFEDCTISKEVEDLGSVIDEVHPSHPEIVYVGHSMGGAVGVIRASQDPRIKHLVSLAGMVETKRFFQEEFGEEAPDEGLMWGEASCPLSSQFANDLQSIDSVLPLAASLEIPWLIVHGDQDDLVPIEESRAIFASSPDPKQLVELEGADHVFSNDATLPMTQAVISFLA